MKQRTTILLVLVLVLVVVAVTAAGVASNSGERKSERTNGNSLEERVDVPKSVEPSDEPSRGDIEATLAGSFLAEYEQLAPGDLVTDHGCSVDSEPAVNSRGYTQADISCYVRGQAGIFNWLGAYAETADQQYCWSLLNPGSQSELKGCARLTGS